MSKTEHPMTDDPGLEAFFAAARRERAEPSAALMARILADAETEIAARGPAVRQPERTRRRGGLIAAVVAAIGGWPAVAGMVTATVAGAWFGFAAPDRINTLAGGLLLTEGAAATATSYEIEDIVPGGAGLGVFLEEGGA